MKRIFSYNSYKKYLKDVSDLHGRGAIGKLAEAAGCDRTYLSQCLTSKVQLTPDHIFGISEYLGLSATEQDYFLMLLLYERSASKQAQTLIKEKMYILAQADLVLSQKIMRKADSNELSDEQKTKYYSSWKYSAVHTLTSIQGFQTLGAISKKTRLSESDVHAVLKDLLGMGLIHFNNSKWIHTGKNIHIPSGSSYTTQNHLNWRLKSVEDVNNKSALHYTMLFSLSKKDWETLRATLLNFIEKERDFIHDSGADEMYCFCCDLFQPLE